jgi:single-stranded DNA-binding protein
MAGTTVTTISNAPLVNDAAILNTAENGRVKYSFSVLTRDSFSRSKTPALDILQVNAWASHKLESYLKKGKHVTITGATRRYQGATRAAVQAGIVFESTDLKEAQEKRDAIKAEHPQAGIVSIRDEKGTTYQVYNEVVDRYYIEAEQLLLEGDSWEDTTTKISADKQAEIDNLQTLVDDLRTQLNEYSPTVNVDLLKEVASNPKATKAQIQEALAQALAPSPAPVAEEGPYTEEVLATLPH